MKLIFVLIIAMICSLNSQGQYQLYKEVNQVEFYTKWGREKWLSKKSPKILMVKVINRGSFAVEFDLGVEFFKDLALVEDSKPVAQCLSAGKTLLPRMSGLMFKPLEYASDKIDSFELSGLDIVIKDMPDCQQP
jgi:hypothetical protein